MPANSQPLPSPPPAAAFVQVFDSLVATGLLARLSGSAVKVLLTLALASSPFGSGPPYVEALVRRLVASGAVSPGDRRRLVCALPHTELVRRTGLGKNTVTRCTNELAALGLVDKHSVPGRGARRPNLFFLLPAAPLDKFHTLRPPAPQAPAQDRQAPQSPIPVCTGTNPQSPIPSPAVPEPGTNLRSIRSIDPTPAAAPGPRLNEAELYAHFARRQGVPHYRPTPHDARRLAQLRQAGYTQAEILAAIDAAFDRRSPDAPPIRMFAYCAAVAALPSRCELPPATPGPDTTSGPVPPMDTGPADPATVPSAREGALPSGCEGPLSRADARDLPSGCEDPLSRADARDPCPERMRAASPLHQHVTRLYQAEIGPVTPLIDRELRPLLATYPDPAQWDVAFSEAARANVRRLSYVQQVLKRRAAGPWPDRSPQGGPDVIRPSTYARRSDRPRAWPRITDPTSPRFVPTTPAEILAAQQRAAAVKPLDPYEVLGLRRPGA